MRTSTKKKNYLLSIGGFILISLVVFVTASFFSETAIAQVNVGEYGATFGLGTADLMSTVINIVQWALGFLGLIAVIMIMYGGFIWMTAGGNPEKIDKAKKILQRAVIGLVIILLSWAITLFITTRIQDATGALGGGGGPGPVPAGANPFRVVTTYPANAQIGIPMCAGISARFNGMVDPASILPGPPPNTRMTIVGGAGDTVGCLVNADCLSGVCTALFCVGDVIAGNWTVNNEYIEFKPNLDLEPNTLHFVQLDNTVDEAVPITRDPASFIGHNWVFTTSNTTLPNPPTVANINPTDNNVDMCLRLPIEGIFTNPMRQSSIFARRCSENGATRCLIDTDCPNFVGGEVCEGTVLLKEAAAPFDPIQLKKFYPTASTFSTRPANVLDTNTEYTVELIAGVAGPDPGFGIQDVCYNHLDGNEDAVDGGTAAGDNFYTVVPPGTLTFPNPPTTPPWSFTTDTDATNVQCLPEITAINRLPFPGPPNPTSGKYTESAVDIEIIGSNLGIAPIIYFNKNVLDTGNCFQAAAPWQQYPGANCLTSAADIRIVTHVPGGPVAYPNEPVSSGAIDGNIQVEVAAEMSNPYSFDIDGPQIRKLSALNGEPHGGIHQYVSVWRRGANGGFGAVEGLVNIKNMVTGAVVTAPLPPDPPCDNTWTNSQVIVKVPDLTAAIGIPACDAGAVGGWENCAVASEVAFQVITAGLDASNWSKFVYTNEEPGPGLCEVAPTCGQEGININLTGESFGDPNPPYGVEFFDPQILAAPTSWPLPGGWVATANVPNGIANDDYSVHVRNEFDVLSNGLRFDVPCGDIPFVAVNSSCANFCANDPTITGCVENTDCPAVPAPQLCMLGMKTPNPYPNQEDVCLDAMIGVRFITGGGLPIAMNPATASGVNHPNYEIWDCGADATCAAPALIPRISTILAAPDDDRLAGCAGVGACAPLNPDTYYKVVIKRDVESTLGAKMNSDYEWIFHTGTSNCPVESVVVSPLNGLIWDTVAPNDRQVYNSLPMGANCTIVNPALYTWAWTIDDALLANLNPVGPNNQSTAILIPPGPAGTERTYVNADIPAEGISGRARLTVKLDSCAFNPGRCTNPAQGGCVGSSCDIVADRCYPSIADYNGDFIPWAPMNGPQGQFVKIEGCWFGNYDNSGLAGSNVFFGGNPGIFECGNPWTPHEITVTQPNAFSGLVNVKVSDTIGGYQTALAPVSQNGAPYTFTWSANCARTCDPVTAPDYAYRLCNVDADCGGVAGSCPALGAPQPGDGPPGICPPLSRTYAKEGYDITISGKNFNPINPPFLNPATSRVYYHQGLEDPYADVIARVGGSWTIDTITESIVPVGTESGGVTVQVNDCPSNPESLFILCSSNSDCNSGCCKFNGVQKVCQDFAACSAGYPGQPCRLVSNFNNNTTCEEGPEHPAGFADPANYRCIDSVRHLETVGPMSSEVYPPVGEDNCTVCCDPDQDNDGDTTDGPGGAQKMGDLICTANVGACTAVNNDERGMYCGCDGANPAIGDLQCDPLNTDVVACGTDTCCWTRPAVDHEDPNNAIPVPCTNAALGFWFDTFGADGMDPDSIELGVSVSVTHRVLLNPFIPVAGTLDIGKDNFYFFPDEPYMPGGEVRIEIDKRKIKNIHGVYMADPLGPFNLALSTWTMTNFASLCQIDHLDFQWFDVPIFSFVQPPVAPFSCSLDGCDDYDHPVALFPGNSGNQRRFRVLPRDANNYFLGGGMNFTWDDVTGNPAGIYAITHDYFASGGVDYLDPATYNCPNPHVGGSLNCIASSLNQVGCGTTKFTVDDPWFPGHTVSKNVKMCATLCEKPWPNNIPPVNDLYPFEDTVAFPKPDNSANPTNGLNNFNMDFSLNYCRDDGDLPALGRTNIPVADTQEVIMVETPLANVVPGDGVDSLMKEYFFQYPYVCSDETIATEAACLAVGEEWRQSNDDAIGIRVYENEAGMSPIEWYYEVLGPAAPAPQQTTVDGYPAVRSGRSVYISVPHITAGALYSNIFVMSYTEGASADTIEIYNRLLGNWTFNVSNPLDKDALRRDMRRLSDLTDISQKLEDYKGAHGAYPNLEGGTYINNMSMSRWPSWQETLGSAIGSLPTDPFNSWTLPEVIAPPLCDEAAGYDQDTCWNDADKTYQCPSESFVYQYIASPEGESYGLYAFMEFAGPPTWINSPPFGSAGLATPCDDIGNAECDCFNFELNSGAAPDRRGPIINSVDALVVGGVSLISGVRPLDVDVTDAGSGVKRVEFFVDGTRTFIDTDSGDGWSWDFDSAIYPDGDHTVAVHAFDNVGNESSIIFDIQIDNSGGPDVIAPFVEITSHVDGDDVSGAAVTVTAHATDNRVAQDLNLTMLDETGAAVEFIPSCGPNATPELTCTWNWDTTIVPPYTDGRVITLLATTTDGANTSEARVIVTIDNPDIVDPTVTITAPAAGSTLTNFVAFTADAFDNIGVAYVDFYIDDAFAARDETGVAGTYEWEWDTFPYANGDYDLTVFAYDDFGNSATDGPITVTVENPASDVTPPTVAFVLPTPADGAGVDSGVPITIAVEAVDDYEVDKVYFYIDYLLQAEDNTFPPPLPPAVWQWPFNTGILADGWHTIQIDAIDLAGNRSESKEIRINVGGGGGPSITNAFINPVSGVPATPIAISADVTDPQGILLVEAVIRDGGGVEVARIGMGIAVAPTYTVTWVATFNGAYWVDIEATDVIGNKSVYSGI